MIAPGASAGPPAVSQGARESGIKAGRPVGSGRFGRKMTERFENVLVDAALEGDDEIRQALHRLPAPLVELRTVAAAARTSDVDLGLLALEPEREPLLRLAAVTTLPGTPGDHRRQIVGVPVRRLGEQRDAA